jgi:oligoribonuclease (3'-5' exoribonuclease)
MTTIFAVPAKFVATAHTGIATTAFVIALLAGWLGGKWKELCTNSVARESTYMCMQMKLNISFIKYRQRHHQYL